MKEPIDVQQMKVSLVCLRAKPSVFLVIFRLAFFTGFLYYVKRTHACFVRVYMSW